MRAASLVREGMRADEVLKMRGRSTECMPSRPTGEGKDEHGWIIAWHYDDCDVILHRRNGCYRVKEVRTNGITD
jgi:hypothetical protein